MPTPEYPTLAPHAARIAAALFELHAALHAADEGVAMALADQTGLADRDDYEVACAFASLVLRADY